jgi:hypothetical protein
MECSIDRSRDRIVSGVPKPDKGVTQSYSNSRVELVFEPSLLPSADIFSKADDYGPDGSSEPASLPLDDVSLPYVLGPETFELELHVHRRQLVPNYQSPKATTRLPDPSQMPPMTTAGEILGFITPPAIRRWFRRPYDSVFLVHLLDLYFYWIHQSNPIFSRDDFLRNFQSGKTDHCSRILANAIAAFACHYSDRVAALANPNDPSTAGDQFFAEAERLLNRGGESPWMIARALSVMIAREHACGRVFTSHFCVERYQAMRQESMPYSMSTAVVI